MLILVAVFHYVLEIIDYSSFLLSVILIAVVLAVLMVLFVWNVFKKAAVRKINMQDGAALNAPVAPEGY